MSFSKPQNRFFALVPCAGSGSRAGTHGPKQYERIAGQPMVWHTLAAFAAVPRISRVLVVVAPGDGFFERNPSAATVALICGYRATLGALNDAAVSPLHVCTVTEERRYVKWSAWRSRSEQGAGRRDFGYPIRHRAGRCTDARR